MFDQQERGYEVDTDRRAAKRKMRAEQSPRWDCTFSSVGKPDHATTVGWCDSHSHSNTKTSLNNNWSNSNSSPGLPIQGHKTLVPRVLGPVRYFRVLPGTYFRGPSVISRMSSLLLEDSTATDNLSKASLKKTRQKCNKTTYTDTD